MDDAAETEPDATWIELGLVDPEAPNAEDRIEVLRFFDSIGIDLQRYAHLSFEDQISAINLDILVPPATIDAATVRQAAGFDPDEFIALCRASGYDPDGCFTQLDLDTFAAFAIARHVFSRDELLHFVRVLQSAMSRVADASTSLFRIDVTAPMDRAGATDLDYVRKNHESAQLVEQIFIPLRALYFHELTSAVHRSDVARQRVQGGALTTLELAIGFVDIVGYTSRTETMDPDTLSAFVLDFERQALDVVAAHDGRVVKLIGDEVMFVAVEIDDALDIASSLLDAFSDGGPTPRAGLSHGELVARGGDYYGAVVNMASRITDRAESGEILVNAAMADGSERHAFEPAGTQTLKGFSLPVELARLSRLA